MARRLSSSAMDQVEGTINDGAARCAVGWKASPSVRRVCLELPWRGPGPFVVYHQCARLAHTHHGSLLTRILTRWMESGLRQQTYQSCWWSPLCARWILGDVQWFRTRSLMHACGPSAVHSNALFELNALHASDQYDRMRGMCRGQSGEERALERMGEASGDGQAG